MVTEKQLTANRQNALKSTGPRTLEGKAKASKNAMNKSSSFVTHVVDSMMGLYY